MLGGIPHRNVTAPRGLVNGFLELGENRPVVVGHRGWPRRFPDNTLSGLIAAAEVADMIEVDIRRCGDGRLVLSHDPVIQDQVVADTVWKVLGGLDLGGGHHPALLDEALAVIPSTPVQMEIKNLPYQYGFEPDHRLALEAADRVRPGDIVTSFNTETLAVVRRLFPEVPTGLVTQGVELEGAITLCTEAGHRALITHHHDVGEPIDSEIEVYAWTVNDTGRAGELVDLGVTGIISDDPGLIRQALDEGGR